MIDKDIFELMARFNAGAATSFKLTTKEFTLELGKGGGAPAPAAPAAPPAPAPRPPPRASPPPWWVPSTPPLLPGRPPSSSRGTR